jgi:hypothetical protein
LGFDFVFVDCCYYFFGVAAAFDWDCYSLAMDFATDPVLGLVSDFAVVPGFDVELEAFAVVDYSAADWILRVYASNLTFYLLILRESRMDTADVIVAI